MIKVVYANKKTGTVIHDIFLSCKESELKNTILNFGTIDFEFPDKLIKELPAAELDSILVALGSSSIKKQKEVLSCFYISCVKIWEEVRLEDLDFSFAAVLDENYKSSEAFIEQKEILNG